MKLNLKILLVLTTFLNLHSCNCKSARTLIEKKFNVTSRLINVTKKCQPSICGPNRCCCINKDNCAYLAAASLCTEIITEYEIGAAAPITCLSACLFLTCQQWIYPKSPHEID